MSTKELMIVFVWSILHIVDSAVCPGGYESHSNTCFKLHTDDKDWDGARRSCQNNGGDLLSITHESLFQRILAISSSSASKGKLWVGGSDKANEGRFVWVNGQSCCSNWWVPGEPNNDGNEDCVRFMYEKNKKGVNDENCGDKMRYICESKQCGAIPNCKRRHCLVPTLTSKCDECNHNNVFYKRTEQNRKCELMCSINNHCWPGTCSNDLVKNCQCTQGFKKVSSVKGITCQPMKMPTIETCDTNVFGPNQERKRSNTNSSLTSCAYLQDVYGNFNPAKISFDLLAIFEVDTTSFPGKPSHLQESRFGITDATIFIKTYDVKGKVSNISTNKTMINSFAPNGKYSKAGNISVSLNTIEDGERICIMYEVVGGGYLKTKDVHNLVSSPVSYTKQHTVREICYIFDNSAPQHCSETKRCSKEPLYLAHRISHSDIVQVSFTDWLDPTPAHGSNNLASGIEFYQITVKQVMPSKGKLKVDTHVIFTSIVNESKTVELNLASDNPVLYCVTLEVKDVADNVKQARRFVLHDNKSFIQTSTDKEFIVSSASAKTDHIWQTHHGDICLVWKDYFYNKFYLENTLLNPIEPDSLINGIYEQVDGILSVNGTPNVYGIVKYLFSWQRLDKPWNIDNVIDVPNFQNQTYCHNIKIKDGDTFILNIQSIDIANHTFSENRTVRIDRTVPHINNIWLEKDDHKSLFVHDSIELSNMKLHFETFDPHSGIKTIQWTFGVLDTNHELANGSLNVGKVQKTSNCSLLYSCYCPDIGLCEVYNYTIPLNKLVASSTNIGSHNRNYFFTIKTTNNALLSNTEHTDILVDDSPPEAGVVFEGPENSPDIDYTSDNTLMIHWHGFIDHESGINQFRVALAPRCLTAQELYQKNISEEILEFRELLFTASAARFPANFTGKMYVSIIALNNAMNPSKAVCSDGIIRDLSPPELRNVTLLHARWSESVVCNNGEPWLLKAGISKLKLNDTESCIQLCSNSSSNFKIVDIIPTSSLIGRYEDESSFFCKTLPRYTSDVVIFIPNDHIYIAWQLDEIDSQIDEFNVGFGTDMSGKHYPDLVSYSSTGSKMYFKQSHEGLRSNTQFFIFIKARNKAGLETITTVGPIVVDETPPLNRSSPAVKITNTDVLIGWDKDTFYDMEQTSPINQILFEIGHNNKPITPLLEWRLDASKPCKPYGGGCFNYPLRKLQHQDNDLGLEFYVTMRIFNNAGHMLELKTSSFKIPSRYTPGNALVKDIDPFLYNVHFNEDVNTHFTENKLCAEWTGFKHHESVLLELGVGTNKLNDDVIQFYSINETNYECVHSLAISIGIEYHLLIKATCSGGQTISASNGVIIWNESTVSSSLNLRVGPDCYSIDPIISLELNVTNTSVFNVRFPTPLEIGENYHIYTSWSDNSQMISTAGQITKINNIENGVFFTLRPFVEYPNVTFKVNVLVNNTFTLKVSKCPIKTYVSSIQTLTAHWFYNISIVPSLLYELALITESQDISLMLKENNTGIYTFSTTNHSHIFLNVRFLPNTLYSIGIRPCTSNQCLKSINSHTFQFDTLTPNGKVDSVKLQTTDTRNRFDISLEWNEFKSDSRIAFYQWTFSKDTKANHILTSWKTIESTGISHYMIKETAKLPMHSRATIFGCIRAYSVVGTQTTACKRVHTANGAGTPQSIYDVDPSASNFNFLLKMIDSSNLGESITLLHDAEIDFLPSIPQTISGVILYASERVVTWYITTLRAIPTSCETEAVCISHKTTTTGYVIFDTTELSFDTFYFICASSNRTVIKRESFEETLVEFAMCSNGFVFDQTPPSKANGATVNVLNNAEYLTDISEIPISWTAFTDNVDATALEYTDVIKYYHLAIGSRRGKEDLKPFKNVGLTTMFVESNLTCEDGTAVYISIKATDHSNLSTTLTSDGTIVDTSPPTVGYMTINDKMNGIYVTGGLLSVHLVDFNDQHSGVSYFVLGIGSSKYIPNIVPYIRSKEDYIDFQLDYLNLHSGHEYYIISKAVNRAGLQSRSVTKLFIMDTSPPFGGHVMEGKIENETDIDYQQDVVHISGHWKGFIDPESDIKSYKVSLGTRPFMCDVEPVLDVGLHTEITWKGSFVEGQRYYITVDACNNADLCRSLSSDGIVLDNTPPIQGIVRVGSFGFHQKYQPHNSSLHIQWAGFEDPHSSIEHFEVCIGTAPNQCNMEPFFTCLLKSSVIRTGLNLPSNEDLYATVKARNRVGMWSAQTSTAFRVDVSPPILLENPTFLTEYKLSSEYASQWDKSVLRISWKFYDNDSPIIKHYISISTNHSGHTPVEQLEIGSENSLTINIDRIQWLHDGDTYTASVSCCNAAELCTTAHSMSRLIDSTAPTIGGFMPPLTWRTNVDSFGKPKTNVFLRWYGFNEPESTIDHFYIIVGRSYSGNELTGGLFDFAINETKDAYGTTIELTDVINVDDTIVLTIWARNEVGLNSSVARISVNALSTDTLKSNFFSYGGTLEIEKHSCDIHFCNKACTCAVVGKPCTEVQTNVTCNELESKYLIANKYPTSSVYVGLPQRKVNITASSACLTGYWELSQGLSNITVKRFEWSMGLLNENPGIGIFDTKVEVPWRDIGLRTEVIHCLTINQSLVHNSSYVVYVKTWYEADTYAVFQSLPIKVDHTPPVVKRGMSINDSDINCINDYDYIDWMNTITGCWKNVFSEPQGEIIYYTVAVGTTMKADDILPTTKVGLQTNFTLLNGTFSHGTHYFITVTAFNNVGLYRSLSSDGFVVDMDSPVTGVVFNTDQHMDSQYQSSVTTFKLSWHGFIDHFSGIKSYHVAMSEENINNANLSFINVGLQTMFTYFNLNLEDKKTYFGFVKAVDAAGHVSSIAISRGKTIDVTPPSGYTCNMYQIVANLSNGNTSTKTIDIHFIKGSIYKINGEITNEDFRFKAIIRIGQHKVDLPLNLIHNGLLEIEYIFISPTSGIEKVSIITPSENIELSLNECVSVQERCESAVNVRQVGRSSLLITALIQDKESGLHKTQIGIGTTPGGFQLRHLSPIAGQNVILEINIVHGSPIHVTAIAENHARLRAVFKSKELKMDHTQPVIQNINSTVRIGNSTVDETKNISLIIIETKWTARDEESGVKNCFCAIGSRSSFEDIDKFQMSAKHDSCSSELNDITHGTYVFVTVKCVNRVELVNEVSGKPVIVSFERPNIQSAVLNFIPINKEISYAVVPGIYPSAKNKRFIQYNRTCVQITWAGFKDESGIIRYEYRLLNYGNIEFNWTDAKTRQMVDVNGLTLQSGSEYTAEVRAINTGMYKSGPVQAQLLVVSSKPKLTGYPLTITTTGNVLHLNWIGVFDTDNISVTYDIITGTRKGFNDILDVYHTTAVDTYVDVARANSLTPEITELYISITCTYITGMSNTYSVTHKLS